MATKTSADSVNLTPTIINQIIWNIRDGNPDPEQAERLLWRFLEITGITRHGSSYKDAGFNGSPFNDAEFELLLEYLRDAFKRYLIDKQPIGNALGLVRKRGLRRINANRDVNIAVDVLRLMLRGKTLCAASLELRKEYRIRENKIQDIWAANKEEALMRELAKRSTKHPERKCQWSDTEINRLKKIYSREAKKQKAAGGRDMF